MKKLLCALLCFFALSQSALAAGFSYSPNTIAPAGTPAKGDVAVFDSVAGKWVRLTNAGAGDNGKVLTLDNTVNWGTKWATPTGGVTSIGLQGDNVLFNTSVTNSPVTTTGTLIPVLKNQTAGAMIGNFTAGSAAVTAAVPTATGGLTVNSQGGQLTYGVHLGMRTDPSRRAIGWQVPSVTDGVNPVGIYGSTDALGHMRTVAGSGPGGTPAFYVGLMRFLVAAGSTLAMTTPTFDYTQRQQAPTLYTNIACDAFTNDSLLWVGLISGDAQNSDADGDLAAHSYKGFALRFWKNHDTHFKLVTSNGSSQTVVDTGITPSVATNYEIFADNYTSTGTVDLYINGTKVATSSSTMPATTDALGIVVRYVVGGGGADNFYTGRVHMESN